MQLQRSFKLQWWLLQFLHVVAPLQSKGGSLSYRLALSVPTACSVPGSGWCAGTSRHYHWNEHCSDVETAAGSAKWQRLRRRLQVPRALAAPEVVVYAIMMAVVLVRRVRLSNVTVTPCHCCQWCLLLPVSDFRLLL